MKIPRKSRQKTITARIPVALVHKLLNEPDNLNLYHSLLSAVVEAERIRRPDGAAADMDCSKLQPAESPEADEMLKDAQRRVIRAKERREARKKKEEECMQRLDKIFSDEQPVPLYKVFGSGLFTPEQERRIDAILNPTDDCMVDELLPEQLWAYFRPLIVKFKGKDVRMPDFDSCDVAPTPALLTGW